MSYTQPVFQPPLGFGRVGDGVFRSAYPAKATLPFISTLELRSMVCLYPKDIHRDLREYAEQKNIKIFTADVGVNQEPFIVMSSLAVKSALDFISDSKNLPTLIFCTNGKVRTGCVVGCLRKQMGWSIISIVQELEQATDGECGIADQIFIEKFE